MKKLNQIAVNNMTKEAYYFSHDSNARNDIKIIRLRRALGLEGYAIYFCLIEILREQKDHKLPLDSVNDIAFDLHTSEEKLNSVISMFDLFLIEDQKFFSSRLLRSMEGYNETKKRLSEAGKLGNQKRWGEQKKLALPSPPDRIKEKEINESKLNKEVYSLDDALSDFNEMRKKLKKPMTERAKQIIFLKLEELSGGNEPLKIQILSQSIENSWKSIYPLKIDNTQSNSHKEPVYEEVNNKIDHSNRPI